MKNIFFSVPFLLLSITGISQSDWLVQLDTTRHKVTMNWPVLQKLIVSKGNMSAFAGTDSVDYIGQVYYTTPHKAIGFNRTSVKRKKQTNTWHYEAFFKTDMDSNRVRKIFFALYDEIKKTMKEKTGEDFILGSKAADPISKDPMNWLAMWTLYSNYKGLEPGLGKVKVTLLLSGMKKFMSEQMEYTIKLYVDETNGSINFFTWDTPRN